MPMTKLSFNGKRIVLGIALLICLLCVTNYYSNLGIFGRFDKQAVIASFIVVILIQHFIGPSFSEIQEYRDKKYQTPPDS
jgi:hypothetical protein